MVRLLAFALHSDEALEFGRGLSAEGEADLIRRDPTGAVDLWIEVGLPDERDVRKACGRAREVAVLAYGARRVEQLVERQRRGLHAATEPAGAHADRRGDGRVANSRRPYDVPHFTVQEQHVWLASATSTIELAPVCKT